MRGKRAHHQEERRWVYINLEEDYPLTLLPYINHTDDENNDRSGLLWFFFFVILNKLMISSLVVSRWAIVAPRIILKQETGLGKESLSSLASLLLWKKIVPRSLARLLWQISLTRMRLHVYLSSQWQRGIEFSQFPYIVTIHTEVRQILSLPQQNRSFFQKEEVGNSYHCCLPYCLMTERASYCLVIPKHLA